MQRLTTIAKDQAQKDGAEFNPFTFHDLKRKGISGTTASERIASAGHRSPEMMKVYDVKPNLVKPTKN
jgi:hypothetical protein